MRHRRRQMFPLRPPAGDRRDRQGAVAGDPAARRRAAGAGDEGRRRAGGDRGAAVREHTGLLQEGDLCSEFSLRRRITSWRWWDRQQKEGEEEEQWGQEGWWSGESEATWAQEKVWFSFFFFHYSFGLIAVICTTVAIHPCSLACLIVVCNNHSCIYYSWINCHLLRG